MPKSKSKQHKGKTKSKRARASWQRRGRNKQPGRTNVFGIVPIDGGHHQGSDGLYDDCPICQAMRAEGVMSDEHGAVEVDEEAAMMLTLLMREVARRGPSHLAS